MTLAAEVTARVPARRLIQITNPESSTASTVDTTLLGLACTDVGGEFELEAGVTIDLTNPIHVAIAISGVVSKLHEWTGQGADWVTAHRTLYNERLKTLRSRHGIPATSSSNLTPAEEPAALPHLDAATFDGYSAAPRGTEDSDPLAQYSGVVGL